MKITVLIDNLSKGELLGEWGLSFHIEYEGKHFLLDTGAGEGFLKNAKKLGISMNEVDYAVLSHTHYDHSDGMPVFFKENEKAHFYLRKGSGENCYSRKSFWRYKYIGIKHGGLREYADRITYVEGDYQLEKGVYLIPHKTPGLERIAKRNGLFVRDNGKMFPDDFAHEQSLVFDTPKGLVILNSCAHGGADHIITEVAATFPDKEIYAFIGGMHLYKTPSEEIHRLAERIQETEIPRIITGHCTAEEGFSVLKEELGEKAEQMYSGMEIEI